MSRPDFGSLDITAQTIGYTYLCEHRVTTMSVPNNDEAIFEELALSKLNERARLNAMPAEVAQKRVETILYPKSWNLELPASWGSRYARRAK
jgi:hypothetical protein